jgi:hypothetical protein
MVCQVPGLDASEKSVPSSKRHRAGNDDASQGLVELLKPAWVARDGVTVWARRLMTVLIRVAGGNQKESNSQRVSLSQMG